MAIDNARHQAPESAPRPDRAAGRRERAAHGTVWDRPDSIWLIGRGKGVETSRGRGWSRVAPIGEHPSNGSPDTRGWT